MDTYLAVASKRDERRYAERAIPQETVDRILDAGRLAGSSKNRQPWRFLIVESAKLRERLAQEVYAPDNVRGASLVIAILGKGFDLGRAAQNMMLAAWNDGVASCPNRPKHADEAAAILGLGADEELGIVLSFGYPARTRDPESRPAEEWSRRAERKELGALVDRV